MHILLVDDDALVRDMYATKFTEAGHTVEVAENGERALAVLKEQSFDAVLTDMVMPGLTGLALLAEIKKANIGGSPKCVVLSNQSEESDKAEAQKLGADGYIVKAETIPSEVVAQVERMIGA